MSREEQTIQAAKDFLPHITNAQLTLFAAGAMWADEHPKEGLWERDKVIDFLEYNLDSNDWKIIEDLCKEMNKDIKENYNTLYEYDVVKV